MKTRLSKKALGLALGAFMAGSSLTCALAAGQLENITVRSGIQLNINGQNVTPVDASGKEMPVFLYGSTTYVPVRFLSEKYGKNVEWDGPDATVYISDPAQINPDTSNPDLDGYSPDDRYNLTDWIHSPGNSSKFTSQLASNGETVGPGLILPETTATFDLYGRYTKLHLKAIYQAAEEESQRRDRGMLYCTGWTEDFAKSLIGQMFNYANGPVEFDLDVSEVQSLDLRFEGEGSLLIYDAYMSGYVPTRPDWWI